MPYVIALDRVYYTDKDVHPWTSSVDKANQWSERDAPDRIIAYWQKVHYRRSAIVDGEERVFTSALGSRCPLDAVVAELAV